MNFLVENVMLCEYATQDFQGKFVAAGILGGACYIGGRVDQWPSYKLFISIRPYSSNFEAEIKFFKKGGKNVLAATYRYSNRLPKPDDAERSFVNMELPPVKYEGDGTYILQITDGKKVMAAREFEVATSPPPPIELGSVSLQVNEPSMRHAVHATSPRL